MLSLTLKVSKKNYLKSCPADATKPPSQVITSPIVNAPALDAKNIDNPAISSGVPILPRGFLDYNSV